MVPSAVIMSKASIKDLFSQKVWRFVQPYASRVLLAILFSVIASAASGGIAWLVKPMIDSIFVEKNYSVLKWLPFLIIGLYIVRGGTQMTYSLLMRSASLQLVRDLRVSTYNHVLRLPLSLLSSETSGRLVSRMINDVGMLNALISNTLLTVFREGPTIIVMLVIAFYRKWDVAMLALLVLPGMVSLTRRLGGRVKMQKGLAQQSLATITHQISESVVGLRVIKIFVNERGIGQRFKDECQSNYQRELKVIQLKEIVKFLSDVASGIGVGLLVAYGGSLVVNGSMTTGDLFSSLGAILMVFSPAKKIGHSYSIFQETCAAIDRLEWLEDLPEEKSGAVSIKDFQKEICFKNVYHSYSGDDDYALSNVNLSVNKGEMVAIVGASGGGKSTLVDLISRYFDPSEGQVLVDGVDLKDLKMSDLRGLIGLVSQDVILFNGTIRENIAFGSEAVDEEELCRAAKIANIHEFILELPDSYETMLGERGLNMSGGQRQRVAIARAVYKNPKILILDEATSALDKVNEKLVQESLENIMEEQTTIVIAHRLSTVRNADRIVVMDKGEIVAVGTHDELLGDSVLYQDLYRTIETKPDISNV